VSVKNTTARSPCTSEASERRLSESRISGQEMEVSTIEKCYINDVVGEEVVMEDMN
jgi:hypothetical protein